MISVLTLWERVNQYAAKYQSGQTVVDTFNGALAEVQAEIYNDLSPFYQENEKVRGLLNPWVKSVSATFVTGSYTSNDPLFDRVISIAIRDTQIPPNILYAVAPITESELVYANQIPQRKPDLSKSRVYYLMNGTTTIEIFPKPGTVPAIIYYLSYPSEAKIAFTYTEVNDEYVMTYDAANSDDLAWVTDAYNIILYKMLEKYGVETRDQWIEEYSRLGISKPVLNAGGNQ